MKSFILLLPLLGVIVFSIIDILLIDKMFNDLRRLAKDSYLKHLKG